jgi:hypothetical protein
MLVKPSGSSQGRIDDRIVRTIDVLPTIADLVGVRVPWPIDGRSMLGEERHEIRHRVVGGNLTHLEPNEDGGYSFEGPKNFARVLAAPAPGAGTGPLRIWRYGRYGSLVGQRVDAIGHGAPSALQAEIDEPGILVPDRPMVPPLPLWTAGSVDADDPVDLALVADGVVVGWTETRPGGAMGILAAAPLVRDGVEHAELDEIRGQGPSTTLHPVRLG